MDTRKIKMLLRALELKSLSKAAAEYLYTPSAMSHIVDSLESEIGCRLIVRSHLGIAPAPESLEILELLAKICSLSSKIEDISASSKKDAAITIATFSSLSKFVLPAVISGFKKQCPEVKINIIVGNTLDGMLSGSEADIVFGERIQADNWMEISQDPYVWVLPLSWSGVKIDSEVLKKTTFIMPGDENVERCIKGISFSDIIRVSSDDDTAIIQMVRENLGISILPRLSLKNHRNVIIEAPLERPVKRSLGLAYKNDSPRKHIILKFADYMKNNFEEE